MILSNTVPLNAGPPASAVYQAPNNTFDYSANVPLSAKHDPSTRTTSPIVTGTSVLAIKYDSGIMLAADTLGSYGSLAKFFDFPRLKKINSTTLVGVSGDLSDFQFLVETLEDLVVEDECTDDGSALTPQEIHHFTTTMLYNRRCKSNPIWAHVVVAGFNNGKAFLGLSDLYGTSFEENIVATGYGGHIALPLLRAAYDNHNGVLTEAQAQQVLLDSMKVLFYRDARTVNKIMLAKVNAEGVKVTKPFEIETEWTHGERDPICRNP